MNENINLAQILRDCPRGTELYSSVLGKVTFLCINNLNSVYSISVKVDFGTNQSKQFTKQGTYYPGVGECTLFPSENQRDWSKFTAPWYKKEKFDPKTLQPFDKVIVRVDSEHSWNIDFFSCFRAVKLPYCLSGIKCAVLPYNDDTKHLIGTRDEAPEFYRYWEN